MSGGETPQLSFLAIIVIAIILIIISAIIISEFLSGANSNLFVNAISDLKGFIR